MQPPGNLSIIPYQGPGYQVSFERKKKNIVMQVTHLESHSSRTYPVSELFLSRVCQSFRLTLQELGATQFLFYSPPLVKELAPLFYPPPRLTPERLQLTSGVGEFKIKQAQRKYTTFIQEVASTPTLSTFRNELNELRDQEIDIQITHRFGPSTGGVFGFKGLKTAVNILGLPLVIFGRNPQLKSAHAGEVTIWMGTAMVALPFDTFNNNLEGAISLKQQEVLFHLLTEAKISPKIILALIDKLSCVQTASNKGIAMVNPQSDFIVRLKEKLTQGTRS